MTKKRGSNGANHLEPDAELTEREAEDYARGRGFRLPVSRLQQSRAGRCTGPKYLKIDKWSVRYTPRFLDEYMHARATIVIDPADRMMEVS